MLEKNNKCHNKQTGGIEEPERISAIPLIFSISVMFFVVGLSSASQNGMTDSIVYAQLPYSQGQNDSSDISTSSTPSLLQNISHTLNNLFEKTQDSVIQITRTMPQTGTLAPGTLEENRTVLGSGFIFDKEGHIITNNHVVGDAKIVDVTFTNGDRYKANVTAVDPYIDIAVLKIIDTQNNTVRQGQLIPLPIGNSSTLVVGDEVIAIGNPYGLAGTMTTGIVSQTGRLVPAPGVGFAIPDVIQTDAAVNPGNSGGPLLNTEGQVVGVTFAGEGQGGGGIAFAISSNLVKKVVPILIEKGNYTHPYLGFTGTTLTSDLAGTIPNITQNVKGVFVNTIVEGGPADKAGLNGTTIDQYGRKHGGDVIVAVDGKSITEFEELVSYLENNKIPGDKVLLTINRHGDTIDLEALVGARPSASSAKAASA
jgi:S1-C subfamily serine protease